MSTTALSAVRHTKNKFRKHRPKTTFVIAIGGVLHECISHDLFYSA